MDKERDIYRNLMGKPERKSQLERSMHGRDGNTKMDILEMGWEALTGLLWLRIGTVGGLF